MELPYRVSIAASNKPTAAQNYEHGGAAITGFDAPASVLSNGDVVILLAEEVDGSGNPAGAWEICRATWNDSTTDFFGSRTLIRSSTGSLIDWSAAGVDANPNLSVISTPANEGIRLHSSGTFSSDSAVTIGGASNVFRNGYDYVIEFENVALSAAAFLQMRWYESGVGVDSTGTDHYETLVGGYASSSLGDNNTGDTLHYLWPSNTSGSTSSNVWLQLTLFNPAQGAYPTAKSKAWFQFSSARAAIHGILTKADGAFTASGVQLFPSTGTFSSGTWRCWEVARR